MINDEDFFYVTNSLRRMDIIKLLGDLDFARNSEIADILCMNKSYVSSIGQELQEHGLLKIQKDSKYSIYSLTDKGQEMFYKLRDYHGFN